ncbi:MAG: ABC transporter permease [Planctomycetes bacterium]|nr:ABC transporter permease [Planctomycetota bacterium]
MSSIEECVEAALREPLYVACASVAVLLVAGAVAYYKQLRFIVKSLNRNKLRTGLTGVATAVLVFIITLIWSILWFLDLVTTEKAKDFKAIVTERWQLPSQMPVSYGNSLAEGAASRPGDIVPQDNMTWQFFGGTIDPAKRTRENIVFFFCMEPRKLLTMMDGIDEFSETDLEKLKRAISEMEKDKRKVVIGKERLEAMNKKVGERLKVTGMNYQDIDLEVEIIGEFPAGRYGQSAVMNRDYLNDAMDDYNRRLAKSKGKHPLTEKSLNLVWLKIPDTDAFRRLSEQIESSSLYTNPAVKCETASSGVASFLDAYRDLIWGMRWLLVPAILVTMSLVIANAISISVRERRTEMAVLKVLGYSPGQVMGLVLGEALLVGVVGGLLSSAGTYYFINEVMGGVKFPIAFFPAFKIPRDALWWGPMIGGLTAFAGSFAPALAARSVKVSEVFSKIS